MKRSLVERRGHQVGRNALQSIDSRTRTLRGVCSNNEIEKEDQLRVFQLRETVFLQSTPQNP